MFEEKEWSGGKIERGIRRWWHWWRCSGVGEREGAVTFVDGGVVDFVVFGVRVGYGYSGTGVTVVLFTVDVVDSGADIVDVDVDGAVNVHDGHNGGVYDAEVNGWKKKERKKWK